MDWRKVKLMLIVLFLIVNIFLAYMLYNKNVKNYVDTLNAINTVLNINKVTLIPDINKIKRNQRMQKIIITDENGLSEDLLVTQDEVGSYTYIGKKRQIVDVSVLLANFIRDNAPNNLTISNIYLAYFYDSTQINDDIRLGEAQPCWVVEVDKVKYIYNAYGGEFVTKIEEKVSLP